MNVEALAGRLAALPVYSGVEPRLDGTGGEPQAARHPQNPCMGALTPTRAPRHFPITVVPLGQVNGHVPVQFGLCSHGPGVGVGA